MKWAIVYYAMITMPDGVVHQEISWSHTFQQHEQCIAMYGQYKRDIIEGIKDYTKRNYGETATVTELGCAHAAVEEINNSLNELTLKVPLYTGPKA